MEAELFEFTDGTTILGSGPGDGYPVVEVPQSARCGGIDALERRQTHYAGVPGIQPLREVVSAFLAEMGVQVPVERVVVTGGGQEARFLAMQGVVRQYHDSLYARGDRQARFLAVHDVVREGFRIAVPAVVAPGARAALSVRKRDSVTMPVGRSSGMMAGVDAVSAALEQGCSLVYLESPSQLTGSVYAPEEVEAIAELLEAHDALCVWDQSTAPAAVGDYVSLAARAPERTVAIGHLWPGLGLESWQIGYVAAPASSVEGLIALKQVLSICTSTPAQWGAQAAFRVFAEEHKQLVDEMGALRREIIAEVAGDDRVMVGKAVHILAVDLGNEGSEPLSLSPAQRKIITDGEVFGAPGVLRITMDPKAAAAEAVKSLLQGVSQ